MRLAQYLEPPMDITTSASTVLIVDDEERNRQLLEVLLRADGYLTQSAANAEEALACIARSAPDLILLDVMMPGMNGYQLATMLKADPVTLNIPIIMLTAQVDRSARISGLKAGAEEFLTKPFESTELSLRVRNLLRLKAFSDFLQNHRAILEEQVQARTADLHRFRAAMDATADAITLVSRATMRFVEVNATACRMLGYEREQMLKIGPAELFGGGTHQLEEYEAVVAGDTANESKKEALLRRRDGSHLLVEVQLHAQRSGADWIIVGVLSDITERKEAEKRLIQMAHYDALTGLPNRTLFYKNLTRILAMASDRGWGSRCFASILIISRTSTTRAVTYWAMSCCAKSAVGWLNACGFETRSLASAGMSSQSSWWRDTARGGLTLLPRECVRYYECPSS
jgi:PAS domain S-box-containing protein